MKSSYLFRFLAVGWLNGLNLKNSLSFLELYINTAISDQNTM